MLSHHTKQGKEADLSNRGQLEVAIGYIQDGSVAQPPEPSKVEKYVI